MNDPSFMTNIVLRLYFDTTSWIRLFETITDDNSRNEQQSIDAILTLQEEGRLEIISSKFQLNQLYTLSNSSNSSKNKKNAVLQSIALCLECCGDSTNNSPYCKPELDEFMAGSKINHREDGRHIVTSWVLEAGYFITTDRELYRDKKSDIEKTLNKMWHPLISTHSQRVEIINPIEFLRKIQ